MKNVFIVLLVLISGACRQSVYIAPQIPGTVSFGQHIVPIFNGNCNNSSCHGGVHPAGNLNLEAGVAYQQLWSKDLLDTLNPSHSALYAAMTSATMPMPPSGPLDSFYVQTVLRWIEQGGKDN